MKEELDNIDSEGSISKKDVFEGMNFHPFSRSFFLRSLMIGSASIVFSQVGFGYRKSIRPANGKLPGNSSKPPAVALHHYYGHNAIEDRFGVIAPWYKQLNGQCDLRLRIAAETLKRYPWTTAKTAAVEYPDYLFTSNWSISSEGTITPSHHGDWSNGDLGQRAIAVLDGMTDYYRYSGDPAAIAHLTYMGNYVLDYGLTPSDHSWPNFPISVPIKGKPYGKANPEGMIQLDISAGIGEKILRAYQVTKNTRWLDAAKHWGDLFIDHCNLSGNAPPWPRYANPENVPWQDHPRMNLQTGSVVMILNFLEELMRLGYHGKNNGIAQARDAGVKYINERLLPELWLDKTWGCYFWDWIHDMQECSISAYASQYMMKHKNEFPNWRNDVRNILLLFINRSTADPNSGGDVYSGAWAYPESSMCCQRSLWYAPLVVAPALIKYGELAADPHMRELGYRQAVLQTYDIHETGVTEDLIDGGINVNKDWLNIAVPIPLQAMQHFISLLPEELGACRENHIVRSSAVIDEVRYRKNEIIYSTFDAPEETTEILRLSYTPSKVTADGTELKLRNDLDSNGYTVKKLSNGDAIVSVRHDNLKKIKIEGSDPQKVQRNSSFEYEGNWTKDKEPDSFSAHIYVTDQKDASVVMEFSGNQLRVIGKVDEAGGLADVYIDNIKQLVHIDCWNPSVRNQQVLYYKNGLANGKHTLKIVARGEKNPYSKANKIYIDGLQFSSATGVHYFPEGTGPDIPQRMIFGYTSREDYRDSKGNLWRPALEVVTPLSKRKDTVANCWMDRTEKDISGTSDPELYRYGCKSHDFWANVTVAPGRYGVRILFATTQEEVEYLNGFDILINEETVVKNFNLPGTARKMNAAVDLVFRDVQPRHGIIQVRFKGNAEKKISAFVQALEIDPQLNEHGVVPVLYAENG